MSRRAAWPPNSYVCPLGLSSIERPRHVPHALRATSNGSLFWVIRRSSPGATAKLGRGLGCDPQVLVLISSPLLCTALHVLTL